jgi:hypothetical protein
VDQEGKVYRHGKDGMKFLAAGVVFAGGLVLLASVAEYALR